MANEPENLTHVMLREIRAQLENHTQRFDRLEHSLARLEKRIEDVAKVTKYTLGQASETEFRQAEQEARLDKMFEQLEKLLKPTEPA